jgi:hypothetical protein
MKKIQILLILGITLTTLSCSKKVNLKATTSSTIETTELQSKPKLYVRLTLNMHKPSAGCEHGMGLCEGHLDICGWQVFKTTSEEVYAHVSVGIDIENTVPMIKVIFENSLPFSNDNILEIANNVDITGDALMQLNYNSVTLVAGNYDYTINEDSKYEYTIPVIVN